ncbi:MAG: serine/threonine protein kinase [Oligoflexia bacterium]|nr:serine/threonine protein kinase [Oligoflexia bacterium]
MSTGHGPLTAWGEEQTRFFFELTPDRVLRAVEAAGFACTGRCTALNSFENRVYDVELEEPRARRVAKFYRPGRWSREQILEEHRFLLDLVEAEIPAIAPLAFSDGETLKFSPSGADGQGIWYALFPKVGGRSPDELTDEQLVRIGRLLGRIHNVGAARPAAHRLRISPSTYGRENLRWLVAGNWLPVELATRYRLAVERICELAEPLFAAAPTHRIHGDCHFGNLLWNPEGPFFLDFDDMLVGPAVQDLWLLVPGRDEEALRRRELLLSGYEEMRAFDRSTLRLVEALRALRIVHYSAWIARRWGDPAFPAAFPEFGSYRYWADESVELHDLVERLASLG